MRIYNESENLVGLYQEYGLTAYVRTAKMTWSQDDREHDIITFLGVKDDNNNKSYDNPVPSLNEN